MREEGNASKDLPTDEDGEEQVVALAEQREESSSAADDDDVPKSLAASSINKQGADSSTSSSTGNVDVNADIDSDVDDAKIEISTESNDAEQLNANKPSDSVAIAASSDTSTLQSDAGDKQASCVDTSDTTAADASETSTAAISSKDKDEQTTKESVTKISPSSSKPEPVEAPASAPLPVPVQPKPRPKVKVHLIAVGSAPILKKTKFLLSSTEQFGTLVERLRKMLKLTGPSLFLYINQSFVPSLEDLIGDLGDLFSVRGELQVHYSIQEAWG